jgi:hypothetical protein
MYGTFMGGVFFTEHPAPEVPRLGRVDTEISRQNADLNAVKAALAEQVARLGGNALVGFRYGQRAHRGMELLAFKWDTESWYGEGDAVAL